MDIPSVNIAPFLDGKNKSSVSDQVAASCRDIGFLVIRGHGLKNTILQNAFGLIRAFMDLPQANKDRWHPKGPSRQRGYHGFATRGLATTLDNDAPADLRETIFLGPIDDHRLTFSGNEAAQIAYWPNTVPKEPKGIDDSLRGIYREFELVSNWLLRIFAHSLNLREDYFTDKIDRHFSILSCHHYPALIEPPRPGQLRTGAHTDFGALTILAMTDASGGLEVKMPDGHWRGVQAGRNELVVNLGDMMARWTNGRWRSTLHRVANPKILADATSRRQSIGYFMHPNFDTLVECLPTCLDPDEQPRYAPITAGEHIAMKIAKSHDV